MNGCYQDWSREMQWAKIIMAVEMRRTRKGGLEREKEGEHSSVLFFAFLFSPLLSSSFLFFFSFLLWNHRWSPGPRARQTLCQPSYIPNSRDVGFYSGWFTIGCTQLETVYTALHHCDNIPAKWTHRKEGVRGLGAEESARGVCVAATSHCQEVVVGAQLLTLWQHERAGDRISPRKTLPKELLPLPSCRSSQ